MTQKEVDNCVTEIHGIITDVVFGKHSDLSSEEKDRILRATSFLFEALQICVKTD